MKMRFALAALTAATLSSMAFAQMGPGMGQGRGPGMGAGGDCPMHQQGGPQGKGGMMGHGGMGGMHGGGMGGGMMGGPGFQGVMALDLTADQRAKVTEIQRDMARKRHTMMGTMRETHWKMQDARKDGFNEDAARKNFDVMAALRKEMFEAGLDARKRVDALLTPEQRARLKAMGPGKGPGHGPMRGQGPGPKA